MAARKKWESAHISILEAVETLEGIADLEFEKEIKVASEEEIAAQNHLVTAKAVQWLDKEDPDETVRLIKDTFHVVLDYLREFYKNEGRFVQNPKAVEGVKTIMVLVGDAAQKLDRYTTLFQHTKARSVKALSEYKQLQEFYLTRIARKVDERVLSKWILELTKGVMSRITEAPKLKAKRLMPSNHVFMDLESVKKDTEYELFFLRKEDGTRFFNPRLIRNIKLVCDFGESISREEEVDPFETVKTWQDQAVHVVAKSILNDQGATLDRFFRETKRAHNRELVAALNNAIVALMMAANPRNLIRNAPAKPCIDYFVDFQFFLRRALHSDEYKRFIVYPPKKSARMAHCLLEVAHNLCRSFFIAVNGFRELVPVFERLLKTGEKELAKDTGEQSEPVRSLADALVLTNKGMKKLIRHHPNGPLIKVLEILGEGSYHTFDPLAQFNIPHHLYTLYIGQRGIGNIRMPSPIHQEIINKAEVAAEFMGLLRAYARKGYSRKHLLINLQDRTSWNEHFRATVIEELQNVREFGQVLTVVTLPKDTEFYHQVKPYEGDHQANLFIEHFREHLEDENCGFYFPPEIKKKLWGNFVDKVIYAVHELFFGNMNVLSVKNRLDFIEIVYCCLQLKLIELVNPDTFSLTCKDGIDIGLTASAALLGFIEILNTDKIEDEKVEQINLMLYTSPVLIRERSLIAERFDRMTRALRRIENVKQDMGAKEFRDAFKQLFGPLFKSATLSAKVQFPKL